jgi:hypothetical protein
MTSTKTLVLAAVTALSLGVGTAMAQESAGGVNGGPNETALFNKALARQARPSAAPTDAAPPNVPQYGSSDRSNVSMWWGLAGRDGGGR